MAEPSVQERRATAPGSVASRRVSGSRTSFGYVFRGLSLNTAVAFLVLEAVQGIIFTVRATEGISFDFLLMFPVLLRAFGEALIYTIPISLLFGAALLIGRLLADREVLALTSFGVNPLRTVTAPLALGALLAGASFYLNQTWVPEMRFANRQVQTLILENIAYLGEGSNLEIPALRDWSIWIRSYRGPELRGLFVAIDPRDLESATDVAVPAKVLKRVESLSYAWFLYAERARVGRGTGKLEGHVVLDLEGVSWFGDAELLEKRVSSDFMQSLRLERMQLSLPLTQRNERRLKELRGPELLAAIGAASDEGRQAEGRGDGDALAAARRKRASLVTEFHRRLALSLCALTFPVAAFIIGLWTRSTNRLMPFFLASSVVPAVYFGLEMLGNRIAKTGAAPWAMEYLGILGLLVLCAVLAPLILRLARR